MNKQPTIILGGDGMLGQDLCKRFDDHELLVWDKNDLDITDADAVKKQFVAHKPAFVINAAAFNAVDAIEEDSNAQAVAQAVNVEGPRNIAHACTEVGARFIHYSTDYVFDGEKREGYTESDTPNPVSVYGESKLAGERAAQEHDKTFIIRTCKLFGEPGKSEVSKKSFVDTMLGLAKDRDSLDVVDSEYASPTYTPDLADATYSLLQDSNSTPGIYHITNSGACTWYEFAQEIFRIADVDIQVNPVTPDAFPRPAQRPQYSQLLNTKLPGLRSWQDALTAYLS